MTLPSMTLPSMTLPSMTLPTMAMRAMPMPTVAICDTMMPTTARSLRAGAGRARRQPRGPGVRRQGPARVQLWRGLRAGVLLHGRWLLCTGRRGDALPQGLHHRHRAGVKPVLGAVGAGGSGGSGQRTQPPCSVRGQRVARGRPSTPLCTLPLSSRAGWWCSAAPSSPTRSRGRATCACSISTRRFGAE